jgi:hypothetical protein
MIYISKVSHLAPFGHLTAIPAHEIQEFPTGSERRSQNGNGHLFTGLLTVLQDFLFYEDLWVI